MTRTLLSGIFLAVAAIAAPPASAGVLIGGSSLLTGADQARIEAWAVEALLPSSVERQEYALVGMTLTKIFTKTAGSTSRDFHAAVDIDGRPGRNFQIPTLTVLRVLGGTYSGISATDGRRHLTTIPTQIVGGYNPQSWNSLGGFHSFSDDFGFLFNLTQDLLFRERTDYGGLVLQTFDHTDYGPSFGLRDLWVERNLTTGGTAQSLSYGNGLGGTNILNNGDSFTENLSYGELEVFAVTPGPIDVLLPEPSSLALMATGLVSLVALRRRHRRHAVGRG